MFFKGLTGILVALGGWFTTILGMKGESRYSRVLRTIVGTCFTVFVLIVTLITLDEAVRYTFNRFGIGSETDYESDCLSNQYLSRGLTFHHDNYGNDGYVFDCDGNKLLTGISWIAKPLGFDSLVCYSDGSKRGYFNMYTGKVVIEPTYPHAWIFSEGLAAVDDNGWIKFIDETGKVVIDKHIPYMSDKEGCVFHNGYCVVYNDKGDRFGLIDRKGDWALSPEYFSIFPVDSLWIVDRGREKALLGSDLKEVLPFMPAEFEIGDEGIYATMNDHTIRKYDSDGVLVEDFYISHIGRMLYDTDELRENSVAESGSEDSSDYSDETEFVRGVAKCLYYQAEYGWFGLMTPDGKIITGPKYSDISAIGHDLYLCKDASGNGILLNGKGEKVDAD